MCVVHVVCVVCVCSVVCVCKDSSIVRSGQKSPLPITHTHTLT